MYIYLSIDQISIYQSKPATELADALDGLDVQVRDSEARKVVKYFSATGNDRKMDWCAFLSFVMPSDIFEIQRRVQSKLILSYGRIWGENMMAESGSERRRSRKQRKRRERDRSPKEALMEAFEFLDDDGDGLISVEELVDMLDKVDVEVTMKEAKKVRIEEERQKRLVGMPFTWQEFGLSFHNMVSFLFLPLFELSTFTFTHFLSPKLPLYTRAYVHTNMLTYKCTQVITYFDEDGDSHMSFEEFTDFSLPSSSSLSLSASTGANGKTKGRIINAEETEELFLSLPDDDDMSTIYSHIKRSLKQTGQDEFSLRKDLARALKRRRQRRKGVEGWINADDLVDLLADLDLDLRNASRDAERVISYFGSGRDRTRGKHGGEMMAFDHLVTLLMPEEIRDIQLKWRAKVSGRQGTRRERFGWLATDHAFSFHWPSDVDSSVDTCCSLSLSLTSSPFFSFHDSFSDNEEKT